MVFHATLALRHARRHLLASRAARPTGIRSVADAPAWVAMTLWARSAIRVVAGVLMAVKVTAVRGRQPGQHRATPHSNTSKKNRFIRISDLRKRYETPD